MYKEKASGHIHRHVKRNEIGSIHFALRVYGLPLYIYLTVCWLFVCDGAQAMTLEPFAGFFFSFLFFSPPKLLSPLLFPLYFLKRRFEKKKK